FEKPRILGAGSTRCQPRPRTRRTPSPGVLDCLRCFAARSVFPGFRRLGLCFCCLCLRLLGARLEALELRRQDVLLGAATLLVVSEARAGRDEASDDDVLLEPAQ